MLNPGINSFTLRPAVHDAFAQCAAQPTGSDCDAIAESASTAIAQAVVEAITNVTGTVSGGSGCSGSSLGNTTAQVRLCTTTQLAGGSEARTQ